ncbi:MAG: TldD/PmbA family protein [Candidatus Heimdallarchaeota archaeon]
MIIIEDLLIFAVREAERNGAFIEARYEDLTLRTLVREKETLKEVISNRRLGIAITAYYQGVQGFSFTASVEKSDISETVTRAIKIAKVTEPTARLRLPFDPDANLPDVRTPLSPKHIKKHPHGFDLEFKKEMVDRAVDTVLSFKKPKPNSVIGRYGELTGIKMLYTSEDRMVVWKPLITDLRIGAIIKDDRGELLRAGDGSGGAWGLDHWEKSDNTPEKLGENAYNWAVEKSNAKKPPAGEHRVLTDPKLTAVLVHESFGHLCEADGVVENTSPLSGKIGEKIATEEVSAIDVGTMDGTAGGLYLPFDDQGVPTARTVLVEKGILKSYLHNRGTENYLPETGGLSGNARAITYRFAPIPRMKNTIFLPGSVRTEEEMLELLDTGIYSIDTTGGSVALGEFQFFATRGYWVENGEKKYPLRDHLLTGNILKALQKVEGVGQDSVLLSGYFGGCGKAGQYPLSVGMGAPHMLFSGIQVGGEA